MTKMNEMSARALNMEELENVNGGCFLRNNLARTLFSWTHGVTPRQSKLQLRQATLHHQVVDAIGDGKLQVHLLLNVGRHCRQHLFEWGFHRLHRSNVLSVSILFSDTIIVPSFTPSLIIRGAQVPDPSAPFITAGLFCYNERVPLIS